MSIVSYEYYNDTYVGESVLEADFPRLDARAEELIAQITRGRATEATFPTLPAWQQAAVQKAICAQIEYYAYEDVSVATEGLTGADFSLGRVSVRNSDVKSGKTSMICPAAVSHLEQTGLLQPSVGTVDSPFLPLGPWGV